MEVSPWAVGQHAQHTASPPDATQVTGIGRREGVEAYEPLLVKFRRTQYPPHKNQHAPEKSDITSPMENSHPNVYAISDLATGNGNDVTPFSQQSVVLTGRVPAHCG